MKKLSLILTFLFLSCFSVIGSYGQEAAKKINQKILSNNRQPSLIIFNENADYKSANYNAVFKEQLKQNAAVSFSKIQSESDQIGYTHDKFQCFYKGIKVEFSTYTLHSKDGKVASMSGELYNIKNLDIAPKITAATAFEKAVKHIDAQEYLWENPADAKVMEYQKPTGELVILPPMDDLLKERTSDNMRLAYKFDIYGTNPISRGDVYVDAENGKILFYNAVIKHPEEIHSPIDSASHNRQSQSNPSITHPVANAGGPILITGSVTTRYSGSRSISFSDYQGDMPAPIRYQLFEATRGAGSGVETLSITGSNYSSAVRFGQPTAAFSFSLPAEVANKDNGALDAHWGTEKAYDYWAAMHGRNSFDNRGKRIKNYVHGTGTFWNGSVITYEDSFIMGGSGTAGNVGMDMTTCIDFLGHEFGHAICSYTANLTYSNESGSLNEGLSDIWGACLEYYAKESSSNLPSDAVWNIGNDISPNPSNIIMRSLKNPSLNYPSRPYCDTYGGTNFCTNRCDIYINLPIISHWFFILAAGETATNDLGNSYSVTGIGMTKAQQITYRMESVYLTGNSTFAHAKLFGIQSAIDLFGINSPEAIATTNAFYAVGLGTQYAADTVVPTTPTTLTSTGNTSSTISLSWTGSTDNSGIVSYNIYLSNGTLIGTSATTTYTISGLLANTGYTFYVRAKDNVGNLSANSNNLTVSTGALSYCTPIVPSPISTYFIDYIGMGSISNTTIQNGYSDYTGTLSTNLNLGSNTISYSSGNNALLNWRIWIDYNRNGAFEVNELAVADVTSNNGIFTNSFVIPSTVATGPTRMRIRLDLGYASQFSGPTPACNNASAGEVEDYTINIVAARHAEVKGYETKSDFDLYPNPANEILNVVTLDESHANYRVVNSLGQDVMHGNLETKEINISALAGGVYFFEIESNGESQVKKFVKQ